MRADLSTRTSPLPGSPLCAAWNRPVQDGRRDFLVSACLCLLVLLVYLLTLCRGIYTGDDGDFIVCMATWGNSHPTGYPTFLLLGRLFLWLLAPLLSEPAARINVMTALFGACSSGLFYRFLVSGPGVPRYLAAAGALLLAFSPTLWQQSLSCEVYSLTCLYLCALLYMASVWWERPGDTRLLRAIALLYGLASTNHLTIVLFLPGFLGFVLYYRPSLLRGEINVLLSLVGLFVLPLSLYAYLPLAALYGHSPLNWGDPSTPARFWYKITGAQYHAVMFQSWHAAAVGAVRYGHLLWNEFRPWTLWLVPFGIASLWRRDRPLLFLLLWIWVANLAYAINYSIFDIYVYYIPSYVVTAALIVTGTSELLHQGLERCGFSSERRAHYTPLLAAVFLALPILYMSFHYGETDESGNYMESDYSENILRSAPSGAIAVFGDITIGSVWYRKFVLHERKDVTVINRDMLYGGALPYMAWYYDHVGQMYPDLYATYGKRPPRPQEFMRSQLLIDVIRRALQRGVPVIWIPNDEKERSKVDRMGTSYAELIDRNFDKVVWGVGQRLYLKGTAPSPEVVFAANQPLWPSFTYHDLADWAHQDPEQKNIALRYFNALMAWAQLCEMERRYDLAEQAYRLAGELYSIEDVRTGIARCETALLAARSAGKGRPTR